MSRRFLLYKTGEKMENVRHANHYDNVAAHETVKRMMARRDWFEVYFNIDREGFCSFRLRSIQQAPFEYQISRKAYAWVLEYLIRGKSDDGRVDPTQPLHGDGVRAEDFRKLMFLTFMSEFSRLKLWLGGGIGDRPERFTSYVKLNFGVIYFFFRRDEKLLAYMREKQFI